MNGQWQAGLPGVLVLPSGRRVRGRSLHSEPVPRQEAHLSVVLLGRPPRWQGGSRLRWVRWPDFWLPTDPSDARAALEEALGRCGEERVEIACMGARGRTGTALACLAILDGVPPDQAVRFVRQGYHPRAVEMPWQHRFVRRFGADATG
ncbi:MAG: protein tyrosine phosphatase [Kineosporiaceae bacterium]